jgi:NAD(P)-dependent dehydrogenase (short-subunit alcohol dehydrogenase family)
MASEGIGMTLRAFARDALEGQRALVTGGARGIGEAISRQLAAMGADVVIADLDQTVASTTADEITNAGGRAQALAVDLSDRDGLGAFCRSVGPIDILVNNAGPRQLNGPFMTMTDEDWNEQFAVLLWAPIRLIRELGPLMAERGHGSIVNIISTSAQHPAPFVTPYAAAKAAMEVVTKSTALELGPSGVRSNGVAPAFVPTERNRPVWDAVGFSASGMGRRNPLGRIATPQDMAGVVAWLVTDAAQFVNGQIVTVDGGSGAGVFMPPPEPPN